MYMYIYIYVSIYLSRPGSSCDDRLETPDYEELNSHFRSLFKGVDEYRAGVVST